MNNRFARYLSSRNDALFSAKSSSKSKDIKINPVNGLKGVETDDEPLKFRFF